MPRCRERFDASEWRVPGIARGGSLAPRRVVAPPAAGGLAGRARRVGRAVAAAIAALTALATHSQCLGQVDLLARASWCAGRTGPALALARRSILCRSRYHAEPSDRLPNHAARGRPAIGVLRLDFGHRRARRDARRPHALQADPNASAFASTRARVLRFAVDHGLTLAWADALAGTVAWDTLDLTGQRNDRVRS